MSTALTEKVAFDFIRYANCWEDADILLQGLNPEPGSKILSIGSAGDNSFSLLTRSPQLVLAVDVNRVQLYLIELKKTAIQQLSYEDLLAFLGFKDCAGRAELFNSICTRLQPETRAYWESNLEQIRNGIINQGKFERYFQLFSSKVLPWIHTEQTVEQLFLHKSKEKQQEFYHSQWNTWRWRLLFKIFFSKYVMGKYGRDPEFLKEVQVPVGQYIFQKAENHLQSVDAQQNFILRYNLTGNFGSMLPHYLRPENIAKVKANIDCLQILEGYAEEAFQEYGTFRYMNLSNIFEYMNPQQFASTAQKLVDATESGGRIAYWNLMVPRSISTLLPDKVDLLQKKSHELSEKDKGFFYSRFIIDQVK